MIDSKDDALNYGLDEEVWKRHNCWNRKQVSGCPGLGTLSGVREVFYILAVVVVTRLKTPVTLQKGRNSLCLNHTSINQSFRTRWVVPLSPYPDTVSFFSSLQASICLLSILLFFGVLYFLTCPLPVLLWV